MEKVIKFTKYRKFAYMLSALLLVSFIAITYMRGGLVWGIDFLGGAKVTVRFAKDVSMTDIKNTLSENEINASVQKVGDEDRNEYLIYSKLLDRPVYDFMGSEFSGTYSAEDLVKSIVDDKYDVAPPVETEGGLNSVKWLNDLLVNPNFYKSWITVKGMKLEGDMAASVAEIEKLSDFSTNLASAEKLIKLNRSILEKTYPDKTPKSEVNNGSSDRTHALIWRIVSFKFSGAEELAVETVGPSIGDYLRKSALKLGLMAMIMMTIYLAFRFEFKFSVGAMAALLHDVALSFFLCGVLGLEIDVPVIAALLTIFGYSVNDTIVVFDRIRENMAVKHSVKFSHVVDMAISQTLSRTILTSATTLFSVLAILVFGGDTIRSFAIVLLFGITIGTFSSIFVASPIVLAYEKYIKKNKEVY
ncbi:MAG TPA: protein translocase subunit SecF [Spirochaetota bacterium]|nr:protein translocase subunit SecF [Spirochaetota bacterium]HQE57892.1 protein translocase subunit SecF [Spirochaetota bacterium]